MRAAGAVVLLLCAGCAPAESGDFGASYVAEAMVSAMAKCSEAGFETLDDCSASDGLVRGSGQSAKELGQTFLKNCGELSSQQRCTELLTNAYFSALSKAQPKPAPR